MKTKLIALTLMIGLGIPCSGYGAIVVTANNSIPTTNVTIANGILNESLSDTISAYYRGAVNPGQVENRGVGQAFRVAENFEFAAITWQMASFDNGILGKAFKIDVYQVSGLTNANSPGSGTLLHTESGALPVELSMSNPYLTFSLQETVVFEAGKDYAVMFTFTEATSPGTTVQVFSFKTLGTGDSSLSPAPRRWLDQDGTWVTVNRNQPVFYIHTIPEPNTAAFIGVAVGAVLFLSRRGYRG